jgi:mannose-6-phosphate isomerase-like protein (cupin superfamily)
MSVARLVHAVADRALARGETAMPSQPIHTESFPSIVSGFGYSPLFSALWRDDPATTLQMRDLSLAQASGDVMLAQHLRAGGFAKQNIAVCEEYSPFVFIFVLAGRVKMHPGGENPIELASFDSAFRFGTGDKVEWAVSHDAEIIKIVASREKGTDLGFEKAATGTWTVSRDDEESYIAGDGPRKYFRYRDLQVARGTNRRIHIHLVRATRSLEGGTGWHSHSMGQIFYVLRGWADLGVDGQASVRMSRGDAMCVHPRLRHNVPAFSADYLVLEMCVPADYDTIDAAAP